MKKGQIIKLNVIENWAALTAALFIPVLLFFAHLDHGADAGHGTGVYGLGLLICFAAMILISRFSFVTTGMVVIVLVFWGWIASGLVGDWVTARHDVQVLGAAGAIAGTGYALGRKSRWLNQAWNMLNWSLLLFSVIVLFLFINASNDSAWVGPGRFDGRLGGAFGSPNTAATLFGLAILLSLSHILRRLSDPQLRRTNRRDRIYYFAQSEAAHFGLLLIAGFNLILTLSRAGIFFSLLCACLLLIIELTRASRFDRFRFLRRPWFRVLMGTTVLVVLVLASTGEINPNNSEALLENSASRMAMYDVYTSIWLERPFFGHGLGSFNALNDAHTTVENAANLISIGAGHNVILQWLMEQGIAGTLLMSAVLGLVIYPIIKALTKPSDRLRHFLRLSLAASLLVFAHGMVDFALEIPSVMWTYAYLLGLASGFGATLTRPAREAVE